MSAIDDHLREKLKTAWDSYEKNDLDKAEEICQSILFESPNLWHPSYLLGHINLDRKKFAEALNSFETAFEKDTLKSITGTLYYWIGRVHDEGDLFEEDKNPYYDQKKAAGYYRLAKENKEFPKDALLRLINKERSNYEKLKLFDEGIEKFPDDPYFYIQSSQYFAKESNFKSQIEQLQKGLKACKQTDALTYFIAKYFENRRQYDEARQFYLETLKNLSNKNYSPDIHYLIANCYCEEENFSAAESYYKKNLELNDIQRFDFLFSVISLIPVLLKQDKQPEVEQLIENLQFDSGSLLETELSYGSMIWFDRHILDEIYLYENGDTAIELLEKTTFKTKKKQFEINLTYLKILLYKNLENFSKRLQSVSYLKGFTTNKNLNFIFKELSEAYIGYFTNVDGKINIDNETSEIINDIRKYPHFEEEVSESLDKLIKPLFEKKKYKTIKELVSIYDYIESNRTECLFEIAYSLSECDDRRLSKTYYEKILISNPKNSAALNNIGVIYEKEENYEQAIKFFKNAKKIDPEKELYQNNTTRCLKLKEDKIEQEKKNKIPEKWTKYTSSIKTNSLNNLEYFEIVDRIKRVNQKFRLLIERDVNELFFNHIVHNDKASIVLSGSLIELLLTYYCEKKKLKKIPVKDSSGATKNKKLYDCVLSDLIQFCESQNFFGSDFPHLGNLSRIYRNYIHPGRELKESINRSKAELCFISTKELLKKILP